MPVPNAGEWLTELPPHPQAGQEMQPNGPLSATLCAHEEEVWVLGGAGIKSSASYIYSPSSGAWRGGPDTPTPQAWGGSWSAGGRLCKCFFCARSQAVVLRHKDCRVADLLSGGHKMQMHPDPFEGFGGAATHYDDRCWVLTTP